MIPVDRGGPGGGLVASGSMALAVSVSVACLPHAGKSHRFSSLPPLVLSCLSFSHSDPLFSAVCRLFPKHRGGGGHIMVSHTLGGRPAGLDRLAKAGTPALLWQDARYRLSERTILAVVRLDLLLFTALKSLPTLETSWRLLACGEIAGIFRWSTARTIGSTFGRLYFSGTESCWRSRTPSAGGGRSFPVSGPAAMSAAKGMSISPGKCPAASKGPRGHSRHIRYSVRKEAGID